MFKADWLRENKSAGLQGEIVCGEAETELFEVLEWKRLPLPYLTGRSGYLPMEKGFLKIKGLGFFDFERNLIMPPGSGNYDEHAGRPGIRAYQLKVSEVGDLFYEPFGIKPFGGVDFAKALHEFELTQNLFELGVPVFEPRALYKRGDLGVVVLGTEIDLENFVRLGDLFLPQNAPVLARNKLTVELNLGPIFEGIAAVMAFVHQHYVDFEWHLENWGVDLVNQQIILFDLDRGKMVDGLNEKQISAYRFRDLLSFFSGLLYFCNDPEVFKRLADLVLSIYMGREVDMVFPLGFVEARQSPEKLVAIKNSLSMNLAQILDETGNLNMRVEKMISLQSHF